MDNLHTCSCGKCDNTSTQDQIDKNKQGEPIVSIHVKEKNRISPLMMSGLRLGVSLVLLLIAVFIPMDSTLAFIFFLAAYILSGYTVLFYAVRGLWKREWLDENFLMVIASIAAFAIGEYAEGVAVIIFYGVGSLFEEMAINRSRRSIKALMEIKPVSARKYRDSGWIECDPNTVEVDDIILVKAGERLPLDGVVIEGNSSLDTSAITGESMYKEVEEGSTVYAGTINIDGVLKIQVLKRFEDSTVSRILELVEQASAQKANTEKFITKFAHYYTPIVVGAAFLLAVFPPLLGMGTWIEWFYRAAIFLVVSCPCGLVISVPLGYFGGIGSASKQGILIKGGNYLEVLRKLDTVVMDKTGTLTKGVFEVVDLHVLSDAFDKTSLLQLASELEAYSHHPIAKSIVAAGKKVNKDSQIELSAMVEHKGKGMSALFCDKELIVGNETLLREHKIVAESDEQGATCVYIAYDKVLVGRIYLKDRIKKEAKSSINELKNLGVQHIVMLTGDSLKVAQSVAQELQITDFYGHLLPEEKVKHFEALNGTIAFVGDGINDAPVLARADVGIAMGGIGSDAAIEAADVVIMSDDLSALPKAIKIARYTHKIIWQNILFSFGVKGIILLLATVGMANMWLAVFADVGVAIIAILNAIRVLQYNPKVAEYVS
jgi:Zn2+/Cd2+-exporting ATPase